MSLRHQSRSQSLDDVEWKTGWVEDDNESPYYASIDAEKQEAEYINCCTDLFSDDEEDSENVGFTGLTIRGSGIAPSIKLHNHPMLKKSQSDASGDGASVTMADLVQQAKRPKHRAPPPPPGGGQTGSGQQRMAKRKLQRTSPSENICDRNGRGEAVESPVHGHKRSKSVDFLSSTEDTSTAQRRPTVLTQLSPEVDHRQLSDQKSKVLHGRSSPVVTPPPPPYAGQDRRSPINPNNLSPKVEQRCLDRKSGDRPGRPPPGISPPPPSASPGRRSPVTSKDSSSTKSRNSPGKMEETRRNSSYIASNLQQQEEIAAAVTRSFRTKKHAHGRPPPPPGHAPLAPLKFHAPPPPAHTPVTPKGAPPSDHTEDRRPSVPVIATTMEQASQDQNQSTDSSAVNVNPNIKPKRHAPPPPVPVKHQSLNVSSNESCLSRSSPTFAPPPPVYAQVMKSRLPHGGGEQVAMRRWKNRAQSMDDLNSISDGQQVS